MGAFGGQSSGGSPVAVFTSPDDLTTTDNALIPWVPGRGQTVFGAFAQVKTAPVGDDIEILLKLIDGSDGSTISTLGTLTIPDGDLQSAALVFTATAVPQGYSLAAEISQVGSGTAGANLTVEVYGRSGTDSAAPASQIITTTGPTVLDVAGIADGEFLKRVGATVVGATPTPGIGDHGVKVAATGAGGISGGTTLEWANAAVEFDTDNYFDSAIDNTLFTIPTGQGGKYIVGIHFNPGAASAYRLGYRLNATVVQLVYQSAVGEYSGWNVLLNLADGDTIQFVTDGVTSSATATTECWIQRVA